MAAVGAAAGVSQVAAEVAEAFPKAKEVGGPGQRTEAESKME